MKKGLKKLLAIMLTLLMLMSASSFILAFAASSLNGGEEIVYDELDALTALGFDTSVMPEEYDPDSTDNPYGDNKIASNVIPELLTLSDYTQESSDYRDQYVLYGKNKSITANNGDIFNQLSGAVNNSVPEGRMLATRGAAGDFNGDGLDGEVVVTRGMVSGKLTMSFMDSGNLSGFSGYTSTAHSINIGFIPSYFDSNLLNYNEQELLDQMEPVTGDFDGDGCDEVAVIICSNMYGNYQVYLNVYKLKRSQSSSATDYIDAHNWTLVWSRPVQKNSRIVSSDIDNDGVDDLATCDSIGYGGCNLVLLFGGKNGDMFHRDYTKRIEEADTYIPMPGITVADADGDDSDEIVIASVLSSATSKDAYIGIFAYDNETGTVEKEASGSTAVINYSDGNSLNTFDDKLSINNIVSDVEVVNFGGAGSVPYIYLNGIIFQYENSAISMIAQLDDNLDSDGKGTPLRDYYGTDGTIFLTGATAADFTGSGNEVLVTGIRRYIRSEAENDSGIVMIGLVNGKFTLLGQNVSAKNGAMTPLLLNCDNDTTYLEYTGEHYIEYEDPQVLAVVASAPYFKDVADYDEVGHYLDNSGTEFGSVSGAGGSAGAYTGLSVGAYTHIEASATDLLVFEYGVGIGAEFTFEYEKATTTEQQLTFGTSAGQDTVAFYSVPMEKYVFNATVPLIDETTGRVTGTSTAKYTVAIPRKACVVSMALDKYEEIASMYEELPQISGEAVTHTVGDPASYPQSEAGYNVIAKYNGDWAGVDYGLGYISQEVSITEEESFSYQLGAYLDWNIAGGCAQVIGAEISSATGGTWSNTNLTGTVFSGSVGNMPESAREYGYYYAWKLFAYQYQCDMGSNGASCSFPVVSYITTDVQSPKTLPTDFAQYHPLTTSTQAALRWTYSGNASGFNIYRYYDFPEGGGSYKVGYIPAADYTYSRDAQGEIKRDELGRPIKVYTFIDEELNPYTEYDYQIQVVSNQLPFESILSTVLTARTKAEVGSPVIELSSDYVSMYPDTGGSVSVNVRNAADYTEAPKYQWQRLADGVWSDLVGQEKSVLRFSRPDLSSEGEYRCRVNVIYGDVYISAFSDTVEFDYVRRMSVISDISHTESGNNLNLSVDVTNPYTNSSALPTGTVRFTVNKFGNEYFYEPEIVNGTASCTFEGLAAGAYTVSATYLGNRVFEPCVADDVNLLFNVAKGYFLEMPEEESIIYKADVEYDVIVVEEVNGVIVRRSLGADELSDLSFTTVSSGYEKGVGSYKNRIADSAAYAIDTTAYYGTIKVWNSNSELLASSDYKVLPREIHINLKDIYLPAFEDISAPTVEQCAEYDSSLLPEGETIADIGIRLIFTKSGYSSQNNYWYSSNKEERINRETAPGKYTITPNTKGVNSNQYVITADTSNLYIQANSYRVTANARLLNGTVPGRVYLSSPDEISDFTTVSYPAGTRLMFKSTAYTGYVIKDWYVNGIAQNNPHASFAYTMLSEEADVQAEFTIDSGTLTYEAIGGGSVVCTNSAAMTSGSMAFEGSEWSFEAKAHEGYSFKQWRVVYVGLGTSYPAGSINEAGNSTYSMTMTARNTVVYAVFERDNYTVSFGQNLTAYYIGDHDSNVVTPDCEVYFSSGAKIPGDTEITVVPAPGYAVADGAQWSSNVTGYTVAPDNSSLTFSVAADTFINVEAEQQSYTLGKISVACSDASAEDFGSVSAKLNGSDFTSFGGGVTLNGGESLVVTASAARGYEFDCFTVNGVDSYDSVLDITAAQDIDAIVAHFVPAVGTEFIIEKPLNIEVAYSLNDGDYITVTQDTELTVYETDTINVKASDSGTHRLRLWQVNSSDYSSDKALTFSGVTSDITLTVLEDVSIYNVITSDIQDGVTITNDVPFGQPLPCGTELSVRFKTDAEPSTVVISVYGNPIDSSTWLGNYDTDVDAYFVTFTVTASGEFSIRIVDGEEESVVTGLSISPAHATMAKGSSRRFNAEITGINLTDSMKGVTWDVESETSAQTKVENGVLTVAADETAAVLTLKATSAHSSNVSGNISVNVVTETVLEAEPPVFEAKSENTLTVKATPEQEYALVNGERYGNYNSGIFNETWLAGESNAVTFTSLDSNTDYKVVARIKNAGTTAKMSAPLTVKTARNAPEGINPPSASSVIYGAKLSAVALVGGSSDGTFAWADGSVIPTVNNSGYDVIFTPSNPDLYDYEPEDMMFSVVVPVMPAPAPAVTYPTASAITYGEDLSLSTLSGGSGDGTFA